jgi:hypothetical protein
LDTGQQGFCKCFLKKGGINTAVSLVSEEGGTEGVAVLWENKRLDLSVEALVLKDEYKELFSDFLGYSSLVSLAVFVRE